MFESVDLAPPDPILGLTEAFRSDPSPRKINLSVGVYQDADGRTPVLSCVRRAEERLLAEQSTKSYLPIAGSAEYAGCVQELLFGREHPGVADGRIATAHTPGGTGALRVAGDWVKKIRPDSTVWLSDPTWANHPGVFRASGLRVDTYPWLDRASGALDIGACLDALGRIPEGDVLLLHGCCHNPSGVDPTPEEWRRIGAVLAERGVLPLVDFAYQGFAVGIEEDAAGWRGLLDSCPELIVASSFSKNFGLYRERVGAISFVCPTEAAARAVLSHAKLVIRTNYSNPPAHGGLIVTTVLGDDELRREWVDEVAAMRDRIASMRRQFVETLASCGAKGDYSSIVTQKGMFSFSGLTSEQVSRLREEHSIYIVSSGRINVAGMTESNMRPLCEAIASVT